MKGWGLNTLLLATILALFASCGKPETPKRPPVEVKTVTIKLQNIPADFEYLGFAESSHIVEIRARIEGYLNKIAYKEGSFVEKNSLLFQIDPRQYEAALQQANGLLYQQEALLWKDTRAVERMKPLYEQKASSRKDLDDAIAAQLATEADLYAAHARVLEAQLNLSYTTVISPVSGMASRSIWREGALVGPGPDSLLTTVSVTDPIWITFTVSENDLLKYRTEEKKGILTFPKGMDFDVEVVLGDGTVLPNKGKVDFANPNIDQVTGTMFVRSVYPNPDNEIKPGQYVKAKLVGAIRPNAIVVPQQSVQQGRKGQFVYIVNKDDVVEIRTIVPGDWYGDQWVILSGLEPGDEVIYDGVNRVLPGAKIARAKT